MVQLFSRHHVAVVLYPSIWAYLDYIPRDSCCWRFFLFFFARHWACMSSRCWQLVDSGSFIYIQIYFISFNVCYFLLDIDECSSANGGCHASAYCQNTVGSFTCTCNIGYDGDGFNCVGTLLLSIQRYKTVETYSETFFLAVCTQDWKKKRNAGNYDTCTQQQVKRRRDPWRNPR